MAERKHQYRRFETEQTPSQTLRLVAQLRGWKWNILSKLALGLGDSKMASRITQAKAIENRMQAVHVSRSALLRRYLGRGGGAGARDPPRGT